MKIVQVASSLYDWGGIERYLVYLQQGLMERGHEVTVICPPGSPLDQRLPGPKVHQQIKAQFQFTLLPKFRRLFRELKPEVVNIHFSPDFIIPAMAARGTGAKVLMTRHLVLPWKPAKVKRYAKLFDGFIGVSHAVKRKLVESGVAEGRVLVSHSGVDALQISTPVEKVRAEYGFTSPTLGFFGRIVEEKGITTLAEAARIAGNVQFEVFGDGPKKADYESEYRQIPNLRFRGRIEDVGDVMNAVDAVVVPSLWEEAFPYSALEAMSLGKPILGSISGGIPEIVEDGVTGYLFEKGDAPSLARLATQIRPEMGEAARQRHRENFTVGKMAERLETAYRLSLDFSR